MRTKFQQEAFTGMIASRRKWAGQTQKEAAEKIGIPERTLNRIEKGEALPDLLQYAAVCHWLGLDMQYFFKVEKEPGTGTKEKEE